MGNELNEPGQVYEQLWAEAVSAFARNAPELDPHLTSKTSDGRRGVTLAFRPSPILQNEVAPFLRELAAVAPEQYFYRPEEMHATVLSVIPGSECWREPMRHLAKFKAIISEVLKRHRQFSVAFRGVTASPGAVMIQGFPSDDTLLKIRTDLRETLRQHQLGNLLDGRYKIKSAHITVMRFCQPTPHCKRFLALLQANRTTPFAATSVTGLELLFGDWYASVNTTHKLQEYRLGQIESGALAKTL